MKVVNSLFSFLFCSILSSGIFAITQDEIHSLAARTLQEQTDWDEGSWSGTWKDPAAQRPFILGVPGGQIEGSVFAYRVNIQDERAGGADTITVVYQVPVLGWCAIGFSDNGGSMIGSEAVIALPDSKLLLKYSLGGKSVDGVQPMSRQTLVEAGVLQDEGVTTMAFTKIMREAGEVPIVDGLNTWFGAWGSSNVLSIHASRQPFNIDLPSGALEVVAPGKGVGATEAPEVTQPPVVAGALTAVNLQGQLDGSVLEFQINPADDRAGGADTVTFVYTVPAAAWASIAFNDNGGSMIGSEAVIGLPDDGTVLKYNLGAKAVPGVLPLDDAQQTLIDASIVQNGDETTLTFTKILDEDGEITVALGENTFLGAWGFSNELGIHAVRQPFALDIAGDGELIDDVADTPVEAPTGVVDIVVDPNGLTSVPLQGQLDGSNLDFQVNVADDRAGGADTITIMYTTPVAAWVGFAISDNGGFMIGSEAIIGLPDAGTVLKYNLNARNNAGVVPLEESQQTLIDADIVQNGEVTTLTFTKILVEDGEIPISLEGNNDFLAAWGFDNNLGIHAARESFSLDLAGGGIEIVDNRKQQLWQAHGFIAGIAWGLLSPLAIAASVLRKLFNGPLWFQIHRGLNMLVVLATIGAFGLAVAAINQETPDGASPQHFNPDPNPHKLVGLVIFIIAIVQALLGIFRPHAPEEGKAKSTWRAVWEILHRCLGFICLGMAIYQVQSGIKIYGNIFASNSKVPLTIFWTVVGAILGAMVLGFVAVKGMNIGAEQAKATKKEMEEDDGQEQPSP